MKLIDYTDLLPRELAVFISVNLDVYGLQSKKLKILFHKKLEYYSNLVKKKQKKKPFNTEILCFDNAMLKTAEVSSGQSLTTFTRRISHNRIIVKAVPMSTNGRLSGGTI